MCLFSLLFSKKLIMISITILELTVVIKMTKVVLSIILVYIDIKFIFLIGSLLKFLGLWLNLFIVTWILWIHLFIDHLVFEIPLVGTLTDVAQHIVFIQMRDCATSLYFFMMFIIVIFNVVARVLVRRCPASSTLCLVALWGVGKGLLVKRFWSQACL